VVRFGYRQNEAGRAHKRRRLCEHGTQQEVSGSRTVAGTDFGTTAASRKSKVLGSVSEMTKGEAREAVTKIAAGAKQETSGVVKFGQFVELTYFGYYRRKWKSSRQETNVNRVNVHLVIPFAEREIISFQRDELQDLLDLKAKVENLSFSVVDHLRWDLSQIFEMAVAEGHIRLNPARLLFTPREAKKPIRRAMTIQEVQRCFGTVGQRERLIAKLAVVGGMRPGEIFALTWGRLKATHAEIEQRVYRAQDRYSENGQFDSACSTVGRIVGRDRDVGCVGSISDGGRLGFSVRTNDATIKRIIGGGGS
jgi:hypothetical protein